MSYAAAIDHLYALAAELHTQPNQPRRKFRLEDMAVLLAALGNPHQRFRSVLIAGTNGKGSTAATLASILSTAGYRTGLYTSPHLARANERIQLNGQPIADHDFAALFFEVEAAAQSLVAEGHLPAPPSFFEAITAMAFLHFAGGGPRLSQTPTATSVSTQNETGRPILPATILPATREGWDSCEASALPHPPVEIAILEVGLGGRLDATNVVSPLLSILTDISLDHTEWLGPTIPDIAREKAGILRHNGVMITLPQHPEASQAIGEAATALNVRGINAAPYLPINHPPAQHQRNQYPLTILGEQIEINSPLTGHHQQRNLALAIAAAIELRNPHSPSTIRNSESANNNKVSQTSNSSSYSSNENSQTSNSSSYNITAHHIAEGIRNTTWPGRLEHFPPTANHPDVLLDVAHNPAGAWAVRSALSALLAERERPLTLIYTSLRDKAIPEIAQVLFPLFDQIILTAVDSPRAATLPEMIAAAAPTGSLVETAPDPAAALEAAVRLTPPEGLIVATGSVHLIGAIRTILICESTHLSKMNLPSSLSTNANLPGTQHKIVPIP